MTGCPSPDDWFALGSDPALDHHLDHCDECRRVAAMIGRAGVLGNAPTASTDDVALVPELVAPGTTLGRFIVRGAIGAGGMGIVLEAFDPKLERTVALKVVRRMRDDAGWQRARDRVLAEAKAMARLSHPNVIAIHDLIEIGDEHLIAMEHVAGPDLEAWLATKPSPRERMTVILGLAGGLAAAHEAGIVHRDIKPMNVLIANGQARVTDFGLAELAGAGSGARGGTPGYVAPELAAGGTADARSDQYAFAVTAWRTLFDAWPAEGARGGSIARVLERAMAPDPTARFGSMRDVAAALRRAATMRRIRAAAVVAAIAMIGAGGVVAYSRSQAGAACELDTTVDPVWSRERRAAWQTTMQQAVGTEAARLAVDIDRAWLAWQASATAACGRPSTGTLACASSLRRKLVAVIEHAPATKDPSAIDDTLALLRNTDCLAAPPPQPLALAPAARVMHHYIITQFDDVTALSWLGQYGAAVTKLRDLITRVPDGDVALRGELLYRLADVLARTGDTAGSIPVLQEALGIAERAGNPIARVNTMILLLAAYEELGRSDEAVALAKVAEAAALAVPYEPSRAARLLNVLASIAYDTGNFAEAERKFRELLAINEKRYADKGGMHPEIAGTLHNIGGAVHAQGRLDEAMELQRRSLAMFEATVGPDHPNTGLPVNQLGHLLYEAKRHEEAITQFRRTIAIWEKALGPDHPNLSEPLASLGRSLAALGKYDEALALYRRARTVALRFGPEHPLVAMTEYRIAFELDNRGERREAAQMIEHSVAAWDASGLDVPDAHIARFLLAQYRWAAGRHAQARALAEQAHAALAKLDARYAKQVQEIEKWLAAHR